MSKQLKVVEDATCTFCGCVCDDIDLKVEGDRIVDAKRACVLGTAWFLNHEVEDCPSCHVDGQPASVQAGIERAAQILSNANYCYSWSVPKARGNRRKALIPYTDSSIASAHPDWKVYVMPCSVWATPATSTSIKPRKSLTNVSPSWVQPACATG